MSPPDYQKFLDGAFGNAAPAMPEGGALYLFGGTGTFVPCARAFETMGIHLSSVIIWDKGSLVLTRKDYHSQYELIFYGWVADKPHGYYGSRKQTDIWCAPRPGAGTRFAGGCGQASVSHGTAGPQRSRV